MKQTHKQKVKLARKMRTAQEAINGVNLFDSEQWSKRKEARANKNKRKKYPQEETQQ